MKKKMEKGFWLHALLLALPIALQNLLTSCASLIDTGMVVSLGNTAVAAVGVAGRFTFLINVVSFGFCSGAATLISQYWGVGDREGIRRSYGVALASSMIFAVLCGAVFFAFPTTCISLFGPEAAVEVLASDYLKILALGIPFLVYSQVTCAALRATEKVSVPLISSLLCVVVNIFLNYCLIYGKFGFPSLGVKGVAIATVVGWIVQAAVVFLFLVFGKNPVRAKLSAWFNLPAEFVKKYIKIAGPVLLNEALWAVGSNLYVMVLSRQGTEEYAGYAIYETIQQLFFVFFVGICHAAAILVGKAIGRGELDLGYRIAKRFLVMTPLSGVVIGLIVILVRNDLLSLLVIETEGARMTASALLLFYGVWIGLRMIPYTAVCGIFRAGGDTKTGCLYEMTTMYAFSIPLVFLFGLVFRIPFVYLVMLMFMAEDIPKGILCFRHFLSKRWIVRLTKPSESFEE